MTTPSFETIEGMDARLARVLDLIVRIAAGDFAARVELSSAHDALDAVAVGLHMLAESFERERQQRLAAEARLQDAVDTYESAPGLYCSVSPTERTITKCNRAFESFFDQPAGRLVGRDLLELAEEGARRELEAALAALARGEGSEREISLRRGDGRRARVILTGNVARDAEGTPTRIRLLLRDVTQERELEARLLQAQRMDAIGRLAGGIAHDFNNLLAVVISSAGMLERGARPDAGKQEIALIRDAAERAADLTRQLLAFARRSPADPQPVDVSAALQDLRPLVTRLLGAPFELAIEDEPTPPIRIAPVHFEQCLINLLVNARDAMPDGGTIRIRSRLVTIPEQHATVPAGEWTEISVEDSGKGIAPEVLPAIFEPFFSTKPEGSGTGLGLATVYGLVTQAGGHVLVESQLGRGTRFDLFFPPAATDTSSPASPRAGAPAPAPPAEATLLLVEDEVRLRHVTALVLREAGYEVIEASGGLEALAKLADGVEPDLVITDLTMPRMSGIELIAKLREARPTLPVMLMSGYALAGPYPKGVALVEKPVTPDELLRRVREALRGAPASPA